MTVEHPPSQFQIDDGDSPPMAWIRDHIDYAHDYCLIWPFARGQNGYGTIGANGGFKYAHRYICELVNGEPPEGYQAAHSCGRGADGCVNPVHLSWKTPSANQLERAPWHGRNKLNAAQAVEIRDLKDTEHPSETAIRFGVTEANIRQIQSGKTWRDGRKWTSMTDDQVRSARDKSEPVKDAAARLGVSTSAIYLIRQGKSYRHVPDAAHSSGVSQS